MAFSTKNQASEEKVFINYVGVAPVYVNAVEVTQSVTQNNVQQVRLDFSINTDAASCGIDLATKVTFFVNNEYRFNGDKTKVEVINAYGETTWLSVEDAKTKQVPASQAWFNTYGMRPLYVGEKELTLFLRAYMNISNRTYRNNSGQSVQIADPTMAEGILDEISKYFSGNISELQALVDTHKDYKLKVLFGVRNGKEGGKFQTVFNRMFLKNAVKNYNMFTKTLQEVKDRGGLPNDEYEVCDIKEYKVDTTDLTQAPVVEDPFAAPVDDTMPW